MNILTSWRTILRGMADDLLSRYYFKPIPESRPTEALYRVGTNNHPGPPFFTALHPFEPVASNASICGRCGCRMTGHLLVVQGDIEGARRIEARNMERALLTRMLTPTLKVSRPQCDCRPYEVCRVCTPEDEYNRIYAKNEELLKASAQHRSRPAISEKCPACGNVMPHGPAGCPRTLRKWMEK